MSDDPSAVAAGLLLRLAIAVLAIGVPCAAVISRRPIVVLVPIGAVLIAIAGQLAPGGARMVSRHFLTAFRTPTVLVTIFLLLWAGLSLLWTPYPDLAIERFLKTSGVILVAAVAMACLPDHVRASNANLLPVGVAACSVAVLIVAFLSPAAASIVDPDIGTLQRAVIGLVLLIWPALGSLALRERVASAGALAVAVAVTAVVVWMPAALTGLILAMLAFSFAYSNPLLTGRVLAWGCALFILAAPGLPILAQMLLPAHVDPQSALSAIPVAAQIVKQEGLRLITGHGFDTSVRALIAGVLPSRAPRGIIFDVWYELGIVGAATAAALAWNAFMTAARATPILAPFLLAALSCIFGLALAGFSISQLWWMTLLAMVAIAFAIVMRCQHQPARVHAPVTSELRTSL